MPSSMYSIIENYTGKSNDHRGPMLFASLENAR
jgi:hypothetical protein